MRRIATTLGAVVAAATMALALPGSAFAATGNLVINGIGHKDPGGCYSTGPLVSIIVNQTDRLAYIYSDADCFGEVQAIVQPGLATLSFGSSVFIR
ncbi:hypothetical protein [Streptantibioticus ferralitis]|uniref:Uncharacterized protein n=1 Tax=Streptantibioticus ferralitis TaxID=236510 RepID=A0ABT5Z6C9_9ACTN|nr:hypothetical protein [Streptantibioticus ferralitis]MDF2259387.1 hypothetical protein [Streptantibioticus ferralitis]